MARATRIALIEREVRERLSRSALDLLFARAEVISEGQRERRPGGETYHGSTMLTMDLSSMATLLREPGDAATARRLMGLLQAEPTLPARVKRIAEREAERICGARPSRVVTLTNIHCQGPKVFLDVDVEATF